MLFNKSLRKYSSFRCLLQLLLVCATSTAVCTEASAQQRGVARRYSRPVPQSTAEPGRPVPRPVGEVGTTRPAPADAEDVAAAAQATVTAVEDAAAHAREMEAVQTGAVEEVVPVDPEIEAAAAEAVAAKLLDGSFRGGAVERGIYRLTERGRGLNEWGPWKVMLGDIDVRVLPEQTPNKGANAIDLNGSRAGSIYQTINATPGETYKIQFLAAGNWATNADRDRHFSVWLGSDRRTFTLEAPADPTDFNPAEPDWQTMSATFTASVRTLAVRFWSDDPGIPDGTLITGVKIGLDSVPTVFPPALSDLQVPLPPNLNEFIADRGAAVALGKALFWDIQTGSDGRTACASCHWNAGADVRTKHTLHPGASPHPFTGNNRSLSSSEFPFHDVADQLKAANEPGFEEYLNPVISSNGNVVGSQGVAAGDFAGIISGSAEEARRSKPDPVFNIAGANLRQVTGRNAPTNINAVFFDRLFWDGRAHNDFNGVNPFGKRDPNARVLKATVAGGPAEPVEINLINAALASQAVGPILSGVEMSWSGREFSTIGRKLFGVRPLAMQRVASDDSVLGPYVGSEATGLDSELAGYAALVRKAFLPEWWSSEDVTDDGFTHMEANFSLFWGLSLMMYQATLVSDQSPYDQYMNGDENALSDAAKVGLEIFMGKGSCSTCHGGSQFAGGTVGTVLGGESGIERMEMARGSAWYDSGYYNIGVRPTSEDLGVGADIPGIGPMSYSRQEQQGGNPDKNYSIGPDERVAVNGAFKTPTLRNVELTGPYMHNGGFSTLEQVINFYVRGADFFHTNIEDLDPNVDGIPSLSSDPEGISGLVEFMKALTDERVRNQSAPFDHPELLLPLGHGGESAGDIVIDDFISVSATGRDGGQPLQSFEESLTAVIYPSVIEGDVIAPLGPAVLPEEEAAGADTLPAAEVQEEPATDVADVEEPAVGEPATGSGGYPGSRGVRPAPRKRSSATRRLLDYKDSLSQDLNPASGNGGEGKSDVLSALAKKNAAAESVQTVDPRNKKPATGYGSPTGADPVDAVPEDAYGDGPVAGENYGAAEGGRVGPGYRPQSGTSRLLDYKNGLADDLNPASGNGGEGEGNVLSALADKNAAAEDLTVVDPRNQKRGYGYGHDASAGGSDADHGDRRDAYPAGPGYRPQSGTSRLLDYKNGLADDLTPASGNGGEGEGNVLSALADKNAAAGDLTVVDPRNSNRGRGRGRGRGHDDDLHDAADDDAGYGVQGYPDRRDGSYGGGVHYPAPVYSRPSATSRLLDYKNGLADDLTQASGNSGGGNVLSDLADKNEAAEDLTTMDRGNRGRRRVVIPTYVNHDAAAREDRRECHEVTHYFRQSVTGKLLEYKNGLAEDLTPASGNEEDPDVLSALKDKEDKAEQIDVVSLELKRKGSYFAIPRSSSNEYFVGGWPTRSGDESDDD